jgi:hypothetical protein
MRNPEVATHFLHHLEREKGHLGFRVRILAVVAVANDPQPRLEAGLFESDGAMRFAAESVASLKVVAR